MIIHVDSKHMEFNLNEWVSTLELWKLCSGKENLFNVLYKLWLFLNLIFWQLGNTDMFKISHKIKNTYFEIV